MANPGALLLCVATAALIAPVHAQQRCDGRAYPLSMPTQRFQDQGDGTVIDTRSGLMWMRCSVGQRARGGGCEGAAGRQSFSEVSKLVAEINRSGAHFYNDWRLPSLKELASVTERECENPRINLEVFPKTPAQAYWSTSTRPAPGSESRAYVLSFGADGIRLDDKQEQHHARLVRTGP